MTGRLLFNLVNPGSYRGVARHGPDVGLIDADGAHPQTIDFDRLGVDGQVQWSVALTSSDGGWLVVLSREAGLCHVDSTRTNLWRYDLSTGQLTPLMERYRPVPYVSAVALVDDDRRLITAHNQDFRNRHVISDLDGGGATEIPLPDDGFSYCFERSPDGRRAAFHTCYRRGGYRITVLDLDGASATEVAGDDGHLYFGPSWSPDGQQLLFMDCLSGRDAEHMRADLCLARPDGSDRRRLTEGQRQWFGVVYGGPSTKGGGSELPRWLPDGTAVTHVRLQPDSRTAWALQENPEVDDHFNRDWRPEQAAGGADICLVDAQDGRIRMLTDEQPGVWNFRATCSPDGGRIAFCRSRTGERSELWVMGADGSGARFLTAGEQGCGVDHPRWLPG